MTASDGLPFVDEHTCAAAASPDRMWAALENYVERLTTSSHDILSRVLGTVPRSGFEVVHTDPPARSCWVGDTGSRHTA